MYFGGKNGNGTYQTIINYIPPHNSYIELCLGSGAIMRHKKRADRNLAFELDRDAIRLFFSLGGVGYEDNGNWFNSGQMDCVVRNECGISFIEGTGKLCFDSWDNKGTMIYIDAPYLMDSRKYQQPVYKFEMPESDHVRILKRVQEIECNVLISHYPHPLYDEYLKGWNKITYQSKTRTGMATECLYMNFDRPNELHDYGYLGNDFTDRQRIKRKIQREIEKLNQLPELERNAIIHSVIESTSGSHRYL